MNLSRLISNRFNINRTRGRNGKFSTLANKRQQITSAFNAYRTRRDGGVAKELVNIGASKKTGKFSRSKTVRRANDGKFSTPKTVAVKKLRLGA